MNQLTWIHLSDWHQKGKDFDRNVVRDRLINDINKRKEISPDLAVVDFVVFTGDVAFSGKAEEYETVMNEFFTPILQATEVPKQRLFIVPGNHDLDRSRFKYLPWDLRMPLKTNEQVKEWIDDTEGRKHLLGPFKEYSKFVGEYLGSSQNAYAYLRKFEVGGKRVALLGLNSALLSGRNRIVQGDKEIIKDKSYLIIGEPQFYKDIQKQDFSGADLRITIMHHPFDWLCEFDQVPVEELLRKASHFILMGHLHLPNVRIESGTEGSCVLIPAGASYHRRESGSSRYANAYNYVHLNFETCKSTVYLRRYEDRQQGWINDTATTGDKTPGFLTFSLSPDLCQKSNDKTSVENEIFTQKTSQKHEILTTREEDRAMRKLECFVIAPSNQPDGSVWLVSDERRGLVEYPSGCGGMPADAVKVNFDEVYKEIIQEAVEQVNHQNQEKIKITCVRSKDLKKPDAILLELVKRICNADITITDLTAHNPNVFLEYGIRLSIKDDLNIMICHEGVQLPFDVKDLRCIRYRLDDPPAASRATDEIKAYIQRFLEGKPGKEDAESGGYFKRNVELYTGRKLEQKLMEIFDDSPCLVAGLAELMFTGEKAPVLKQKVFDFFDSVGRVLADDPRGLQRAVSHYELLSRIRGLTNDRLGKIYYDLWKLCDTDPDLKKKGEEYLDKLKKLEE